MSVLLLAAAAVMIPFGLASDQGDGLIWGAIAATVVALVLLAIGLRRQGRSGKLASVPPWAMSEPQAPARSASDTTAETSNDGDSDGDSFQRPRASTTTTKRVGVKRASAKKAGGTKKVGTKKAGGTKKAAAKKAAGTKKAAAKKATGTKKAGARRASAAKKR